MRAWWMIILLLPLASASIETIYEEGEADVIIVFKEIGQSYFAASELLPGFKRHDIINGYSGTLTKEQLQELEGMDVVIFEDRTFHLHPAGITGDVSVPTIGADYVQQTLNVTGRNITVAVIDSGIHYNHTDLGGCLGAGCKVKAGFDFVNNDSDPADDNGHGTHVAGIIAANGSFTGVAPNALLLAAKACDSAGNCAESNVIDAINWSLTQNASVISMSLGGSVSSTVLGAAGSAMALAVESAVSQGVVIVISAGNDGGGVSTINTPGDSPNAITVGNANDGGTTTISDDVIAGTSSRGPGLFGRLKPDISAPGTGINSTYSTGGYTVLSGTSMAAPHVSGVVALLLEQNENLTPHQIRAILINTASNYSAEVFEKGAGLVNAREAVMHNAYAFVNGTNSYGERAYTDRWEFVAYQNESANVTLINLNNVSVNYSLALDELASLESEHTIGMESLVFPANVVVNVSSNITFSLNFSLNKTVNISNYAGLLRLRHNYTNVNMTNVTIPIIVSVPAEYTHFGRKALTSSGTKTGDVLTYAYYNPNAGSDEVHINWSSSSNDLDLYMYNRTGSMDVYNGSANTDNERVTSSGTNSIKWIRVHGFNFTGSPFYFWLNITDTDNTAPNITLVNNQSNFDLTYTILDNITLNITVTDDDTVNVSMNNSRFTFINTVGNESVFWMNNKTVGNYTLEVTAIDLYNVSTSNVVNLTVTAFNETLIQSYSPSNLSQLLKKNDSINFTQNSTGTAIWYMNGTNVSNESYFLFNSSLYNVTTHNITVLVTGNITNGTHNITTNESVTWIVDLRAANIPVYFSNSSNITTISWNEGSNATDALNLSQYFFDDDNDTLTYALINASNITMSVVNDSASFIVPNENYFGSEQVRIVATDYNANATSNIFTLTVNEVVPPSDTSGGGGGSGGGSGGGAVVSTSSESAPVISYSKIFSVVEDSVTVTPNSEDISIEEVVIEVEGTHNNVLVKVQKYEEEPEKAETFSRKKYEVLEIEHPQLADEDITDVELTFTVEIEWLEENNLDPDRVALYRYTDEWNELETVLVSTTSVEALYRSVSPGLSTFIIGEKVVVQKELEEVEFILHEEPAPPPPSPPPQIDQPVEIFEAEKNGSITLIVVLVVIGLIIIGGFFLLKR